MLSFICSKDLYISFYKCYLWYGLDNVDKTSYYIWTVKIVVIYFKHISIGLTLLILIADKVKPEIGCMIKRRTHRFNVLTLVCRKAMVGFLCLQTPH